MAQKVALFIDVESLQQQLKSVHNRPIDPPVVLEVAKEQGDLVCAVALADWSDVHERVQNAFAELEVQLVECPKLVRLRESGNRRRDVVTNVVALETLAQAIELLFPLKGGPEFDLFVLATGDEAAARTATLLREQFQKKVIVLGVEGAPSEKLEASADSWLALPMPPIKPHDPEFLSKLVPLLEELERRKRYLNFKYIRETVVRRLEVVERSFDASERLLSDAIACGLLLKQKVEDKYNPGQLFTAYCLNRESEYFDEWGSGEPAPIHPEPEENESKPTPQAPDFSSPEGSEDETPQPVASRSPEGGGEKRRSRGGRGRRNSNSNNNNNNEEAADPRGGARRRRRRRRGSNSGTGSTSGSGGAPSEPSPGQLTAKGGRRGQRNHQQDRVGRAYEAPSRFLVEEQRRPQLSDEDVDEDRILKARGDL